MVAANVQKAGCIAVKPFMSANAAVFMITAIRVAQRTPNVLAIASGRALKMTIDRETVISWAKDAGFAVAPEDGNLGACSVSQLQTLINRAMTEAFEQAAQYCLTHHIELLFDPMLAAEEIRALKTQPK